MAGSKRRRVERLADTRLSSPAVTCAGARRRPHGALAIGALSVEPERHRTFRLKPMPIRHDVIDAIGNTPLIKLRRASEATGCTILGKAEFMNPGQSVKDRPARQMILEAEKRGELKPGGLVVEATAGNTGIGLALVANARGYRTLIVIPDTQSQEKKDTLRLCGAELVEVPAVPYANPNNYQHVGRRLADELRKTRAERRAVRRPVEQPRQPQGPLRLDRPGDLGARPAARSTASSARSAPAARSPASRPTCARRRRTS